LVGYKFHEGEDPIKQLDRPWALIENMAANYWHKLPQEFRLASIDCQAEMMATYLVTREVEGYYNSEQSKKMERMRKDQESKAKPGETRLGRR
jgi:hypothetical protein